MNRDRGGEGLVGLCILKFFFCETSESFESKLGWNVPYMDNYKMFVFVSIHHPRMSRCPPS
jgi:hypothetical protein